MPATNDKIDKNKPIQGKNPQEPKGSNPQKTPPKQEPQKPKSKPKKDEGLKFELTYANGGFNDGVEIKPGKNATIEMTISLYGGGKPKSLSIKNLPNDIKTLLKGYEIAATNNDTSSPEITQELQQIFERIKEKLSFDIIKYMGELDEKIANSIKAAIKGLNNE